MQSLRKGIAAAKSGDKARARRILEQIIQTDNRNVAAWLWLASVVERKKAVQCLEYVLKIDPTNLPAKAGLAQLTSSASTPQSELVEASSQPEPAAVPRIPPQFEVDNSPKPTATASVPDDVVVGEQQVLADKRAGSSITTGLRESAGLVVLVVCILLAAGIIVGVSLATQSRTPQIVYVTATPNLTSREDAATAISLAEELTPQADTVASVPTTDLLPHLASGGFIVAPAPLTVTVSPCEPFAQPFTIVRRRDISTNRCSGHLEFSGAQVVRRLYEDVLSKQSDVGSAATLLLSVVSYDGVGYDNIDAFCKLGDSVPVQSDSARVTDFTAADGSQFTEVVDKFTDGVSERLVLDYDLLDSEGWPRGGGNSMTDESRQFQTSSDLVGYSIDLIRRDVTHLSLPTTADEKGYSFNVTWSFWEYPEYSDLRWMWIGPAFIDLKVFQTQQVTVTFDAGARMPGGTALSPGIYTSTIVIDPGEDCVSPILLPVTMIVSDESCYELAEAPTPTPPNPTPSPTPTSPFTPFPTPDFDDGTWISSGKTPTPTPIPVPTATPPGEDISDPNYVWGKEAYQAEDYEQVLRLMTLVLKDDPNLAPPYWYRGMAYYYLGDYETGLEEMEKALELDTTYALAYADRGLMYSKLGDETRAFADWDVALGLDPTLAKVHHNMGVIYFNRSEYDLALEAYNAALVIDPMRAVTWVNHAETLIELGNPNCAESADRG